MKPVLFPLPAAVVLAAALACASASPHAASHPAPSHPAASPAALPAPPRATSLDQVLRDQMAPLRAIPWAGGRRLRWSDFQGAPPSGGREGALTSYSLFYAWKCLGRAFEFRVVAGFQPGQSWVKPEILRDSVQSPRALRHEQTHFDIAEVHARRMRRYFADLGGACTHSDDDLGGMAQRFVDDARAMQRQYDAETEHGLQPERQAAWEAQVARLLGPR